MRVRSRWRYGKCKSKSPYDLMPSSAWIISAFNGPTPFRNLISVSKKECGGRYDINCKKRQLLWDWPNLKWPFSRQNYFGNNSWHPLNTDTSRLKHLSKLFLKKYLQTKLFKIYLRPLKKGSLAQLVQSTCLTSRGSQVRTLLLPPKSRNFPGLFFFIIHINDLYWLNSFFWFSFLVYALAFDKNHWFNQCC